MHYVCVCVCVCVCVVIIVVVVEIYVSLSIIQKHCYTTMLLWQIYIAGNKKRHVGLHVKCRMLH